MLVSQKSPPDAVGESFFWNARMSPERLQTNIVESGPSIGDAYVRSMSILTEVTRFCNVALGDHEERPVRSGSHLQQEHSSAPCADVKICTTARRMYGFIHVLGPVKSIPLIEKIKTGQAYFILDTYHSCDFSKVSMQPMVLAGKANVFLNRTCSTCDPCTGTYCFLVEP